MSNFNRSNKLRISVVAGIVVQRDAISNICLQSANALAGRDTHGQDPMDVAVKIYALAADVLDPRIALTATLAELVVDEHFLESALVVYHFGSYFPLFDSIHLVPHGTRTVVCYHGITPAAFVPPSQKGATERACQQAVNMFAADRVLADSEYLAAELRELGLAPSRIVHVPPAVELAPPPEGRAARRPEEPLRLVFIGRLVPSKGIMDLLAALATLVQTGQPQATLHLIGSEPMSNPGHIAQIREFIATHELGAHVVFHLDASAEELTQQLLAADALVIPSYHEGFCVPVVEALTLGCRVIASNAGALPETCGGLARTFPAGNVAELTSCLHELAAACAQGLCVTDAGTMAGADWAARVADYLPRFSRARFNDQLRAVCLTDLAQSDATRQRLSAARRQTLRSLSHVAATLQLSASDYLSCLKDIWLQPKRQFVADLYELFLNRLADRDGLMRHVTALDQTLGRTDLVQIIAGSPEAQLKGVDTAWFAELKDLESQVYRAKIAELWDQPAEAFVRGLYALLLQRAPDPEGLRSFLESLEKGTDRSQVVRVIVASEEAQARRFDRSWIESLPAVPVTPVVPDPMATTEAPNATA